MNMFILFHTRIMTSTTTESEKKQVKRAIILDTTWMFSFHEAPRFPELKEALEEALSKTKDGTGSKTISFSLQWRSETAMSNQSSVWWNARRMSIEFQTLWMLLFIKLAGLGVYKWWNICSNSGPTSMNWTPADGPR